MLERALAPPNEPSSQRAIGDGASARMKIEFPPPSSRRGPPAGAPRGGIEAPSRSSVRLESVLLSSALLALALGCGGSSNEQSTEPSGCASDDECAAGEQCVDAACVAPSPPTSMSAGMFACSVVSCPPSRPSCCTAAAATAAGNESQGYASRNEMVSQASSVRGEVRATFSFDAPGQQGWLTFELGSELELDRLELTGYHIGAADRFLTVNTNLSSDSGCAFGFELQPRPPPTGKGPFVQGNEVSFNSNNDDFCYGGAVPGHASQIAVAIFALHPGVATLSITNITLRD
jgi:hypothetical protein